MSHYIGCAEARELHAAGDVKVGDDHVFQGDIFHSLELMSRRPGGTADWIQTWAIVLSHHCEWTKATTRPQLDYPIQVAPLRRLDAFARSDQGLIRGNRMVVYLLLPSEGHVDHDCVVDLRLAQPFSAADLHSARRAHYLASLGAELGDALQAKIVEFATRWTRA